MKRSISELITLAGTIAVVASVAMAFRLALINSGLLKICVQVAKKEGVKPYEIWLSNFQDDWHPVSEDSFRQLTKDMRVGR